MQKRLRIMAELAGLGLAFFLTIACLQLVSNARHVSAVSKFLRAQAFEHSPQRGDYLNSRQELHRRIGVYIKLLEDSYLEDGMVVNRLNDGSSADRCDSLLFSPLYYVALRKL